jgi:hypothetical protein
MPATINIVDPDFLPDLFSQNASDERWPYKGALCTVLFFMQLHNDR